MQNVLQIKLRKGLSNALNIFLLFVLYLNQLILLYFWPYDWLPLYWLSVKTIKFKVLFKIVLFKFQCWSFSVKLKCKIIILLLELRWGTSFEITRIEIIFVWQGSKLFFNLIQSIILTKIFILISTLDTLKLLTYDSDPCGIEAFLLIFFCKVKKVSLSSKNYFKHFPMIFLPICAEYKFFSIQSSSYSDNVYVLSD